LTLGTKRKSELDGRSGTGFLTGVSKEIERATPFAALWLPCDAVCSRVPILEAPLTTQTVLLAE